MPKPRVDDIDVAKLRAEISYCPETGLFTRLKNKSGGAKAGQICQAKHARGYVVVTVAGRSHLAHRLAWLMTYGSWPSKHIDHINGDKADNRIANLRDVPQQTNVHNQTRPQSHNTSGLLGVSFHKPTGRWRASIKLNGNNRHIGLFDSADEASGAYWAEKKKLHSDLPIHNKMC